MAYKRRQESGWLQNKFTLAAVTVMLGMLARAGCVPRELERVGELAQAVDGNLPGLINQTLLGNGNQIGGNQNGFGNPGFQTGQPAQSGGWGQNSGPFSQTGFPNGANNQQFGSASLNPGTGNYYAGSGAPTNANQAALAVAEQKGLIIGSYNIQKLGRQKLNSPDVTAILLDVIARFDVLAVQELVSLEQNAIPWMVQQLNARGHNFNYIVGPRQGYTTYQEQYVYFYNANRVEVVGEPFVAQDPENVMHRSPLVAQFRCLEPGPGAGFSFALINVHTDPDHVKAEFSRLAVILPLIRQYIPNEDDLILLGDFNAWPSVFAPYRLFDNEFALIPDNVMTNARQDRNYDNLLISTQNTREFTGNRGVLNIESMFRLTREQSLDVSDHFPVWGQFRIREDKTLTASSGVLPTGFNGNGR